jgi:hypothetical protein
VRDEVIKAAAKFLGPAGTEGDCVAGAALTSRGRRSQRSQRSLLHAKIDLLSEGGQFSSVCECVRPRLSARASFAASRGRSFAAGPGRVGPRNVSQ